jgi:imidazolonepropionase-like amidohydrolase
MTPLLFRNARIFDGADAECAEGMELLVADGLIQEVSARPITAPRARVIDAAGRTLMPGLIDAHLHAYCSDVSMQKVEAIGEQAWQKVKGESKVREALRAGASVAETFAKYRIL